MRRDQIALQLYTVRSLLATDVAGTLRAVAETGYRAVEIAGLPPLEATALARLLRDAGLRVVGSHEGIDRLREDAAEVADRLATIGCERAIVPWLPEDERRTPDDVRRFAGELARFADELARQGIRLGYHNHAFEFAELGGTTIWDILLAELPSTVELELDVFWVAVGGRDPAAEIRAAGHRIRLLHLKDAAAVAVGGAGDEPQDAPPGDGVLDFPGIVAAARAASVETYIVEQDHPEDPLEAAARGLRFLETLAAPDPLNAPGSA
jgi:sugar phosphate isomerase/epimerase